MYVEQLYTKCLAEAAYYIESNGEAAIIDPLRETEPYLAKALERGATIKYIFETHFHADFVSGHVDLSKKTAAPIVYGPSAHPAFDAHVAEDGETFHIGDVTIKTLHTPGHTMESTTWLLIDEEGREHAIFTGDTLFIGDVGRPDLAVKTDLSREDLAAHLYDSLHNKLLLLPDDVIVYPGHGAGSACGKNMSAETTDTLGHQKVVNYALQPMAKAQFVDKVTEGLTAPPQYFPKNAVLNKMGYESIDVVMERGLQALDVKALDNALENGAFLLDSRDFKAFREGYIPGSVNISLDGMFAVWVGTLIEELDTPIVVVAEPERAHETVLRLARVGYDNVVGYLEGGVEEFTSASRVLDKMPWVSVQQFAHQLQQDDGKILDVRKPGEYEAQHIEGALSFPLDYIMDNLHNLDKDNTYYIHCKTGYRAVMAMSILLKEGFTNVIDVDGGFEAVLDTGVLPVTAYVCPSKQAAESV